MSRITNKNVKIGDNYILPLKQKSISKYEAKVESLLNDVEEEKKRRAEAEAEKLPSLTRSVGILRRRRLP